MPNSASIVQNCGQHKSKSRTLHGSDGYAARAPNYRQQRPGNGLQKSYSRKPDSSSSRKQNNRTTIPALAVQ